MKITGICVGTKEKIARQYREHGVSSFQDFSKRKFDFQFNTESFFSYQSKVLFVNFRLAIQNLENFSIYST